MIGIKEIGRFHPNRIWKYLKENAVQSVKGKDKALIFNSKSCSRFWQVKNEIEAHFQMLQSLIPIGGKDNYNISAVVSQEGLTDRNS